ncbi:alpha-crystallin A chain-like [Oppia nitens]|uniref:alpha-crystallin A chain-like n=1 Tax=Oppia nitens TaxID=1686743 RepID=UPI0023DB1892|nr:alpha-crystallin A chain-like [Oppia nitens]
MFVNLLVPYKRRYTDCWDDLFSVDINDWFDVNERVTPKKRVKRLAVDDLKPNTTSLQVMANNDNKFMVRLDCNHFRPEELEVKTNGKFVTIHGKHEEREDNNGWIAREFTRRYALPDNCDDSTITSNINPKGVLTIEAMKKSKDIGKNQRNISVNVINDTEEDNGYESEDNIKNNNNNNLKTTTITKVEE